MSSSDQSSSFFQRCVDALRNIFGSPQPQPTPTPPPQPQEPQKMDVKALVIDFDPLVPSQGGKRLSEVMGWSKTADLLTQYIQNINDASYGLVNYTVTNHQLVDYFPIKEDGFAYTADQFINCYKTNSGFHDPDTADYSRILKDFDILGRLNRGEMDEVWLFGFPYAGFYESRMAGPGAFFCNAPPLGGTDSAPRRFLFMGFNYERSVGDMMEALTHRTEYIMQSVYGGKYGDADLWTRYTRYDLIASGLAEVGSVHYAPNSEHDYDWGNPRQVPSRCDNWYHFPDLSGAPRMVDCNEWGNGDTRLHHLWWLRHIPHIAGKTDNVSNNWWTYIIRP